MTASIKFRAAKTCEKSTQLPKFPAIFPQEIRQRALQVLGGTITSPTVL
jgi:hypothetical protein